MNKEKHVPRLINHRKCRSWRRLPVCTPDEPALCLLSFPTTKSLYINNQNPNLSVRSEVLLFNGEARSLEPSGQCLKHRNLTMTALAIPPPNAWQRLRPATGFLAKMCQNMFTCFMFHCTLTRVSCLCCSQYQYTDITFILPTHSVCDPFANLNQARSPMRHGGSTTATDCAT